MTQIVFEVLFGFHWFCFVVFLFLRLFVSFNVFVKKKRVINFFSFFLIKVWRAAVAMGTQYLLKITTRIYMIFDT